MERQQPNDERRLKETLVFREMCPEDLKQVAAMEKQIFSQPWSEAGFAASLKEKGTCYLCAWLGERLAGYCGFLQVLEEADITNVAVEETLRGRGVGYRMMTKLLELGEKRGVRAFTLEVRQSNYAAIALYEKLGFVSCGLRKNFYEFPREHAVIMWKKD